jgi:hypothetical protein
MRMSTSPVPGSATGTEATATVPRGAVRRAAAVCDGVTRWRPPPPAVRRLSIASKPPVTFMTLMRIRRGAAGWRRWRCGSRLCSGRRRGGPGPTVPFRRRTGSGQQQGALDVPLIPFGRAAHIGDLEAASSPRSRSSSVTVICGSCAMGWLPRCHASCRRRDIRPRARCPRAPVACAIPRRGPDLSATSSRSVSSPSSAPAHEANWPESGIFTDPGTWPARIRSPAAYPAPRPLRSLHARTASAASAAWAAVSPNDGRARAVDLGVAARNKPAARAAHP